MNKYYDNIAFILKYLYLKANRRLEAFGVANFADISKIAILFIKTIFRAQKGQKN